MSEFTKLNGYDVKDSTARNDISEMKDYHEIDWSTIISGTTYFDSGKGYSSNILKIDLSNINKQYKYINLIGPLNNGLIKIPIKYDNISMSPAFPCYTETSDSIQSIDGNIITTAITNHTYYGTVSFVVEINNNTLSIKTFNSPLHLKELSTAKTNKTTGEQISYTTTSEILYDLNGSMIEWGGAAGFYNKIKSIILSND